jgi:hypothetical protein
LSEDFENQKEDWILITWKEARYDSKKSTTAFDGVNDSASGKCSLNFTKI